MIIEAKAPRGGDIDRSVNRLSFRAETQHDRDILAAVLSLWNEKHDAFCEIVKDRVLSIIEPHNSGGEAQAERQRSESARSGRYF